MLEGYGIPVIYCIGLIGFLYFVGKALRTKSVVMAGDSGYFPIHRLKLEYEELSEQFSPTDESGSRVLQVALMKRAMEGVRRVLRLREEKAPLQQMVRDGVIGESLWEKLLVAEEEIELEMRDVLHN